MKKSSTTILINKIQEIEKELDNIMEEAKELTYKNPAHSKKIEITRKKLLNLENKVLKL